MRTTVLLGAIVGTIVVGSGAVWGRKGLLMGFGIGVTVAAGLWCLSARLVLRAACAHVVTEGDSALHAELGRLSQRVGIPPPRLYLVPIPQPNVCAVGRSSRHATIVVTEGLISLLEPAEVHAVLAHELGHVCRRDILATSIAGAMASYILVLVELMKPSVGAERRHQNVSPGIVMASVLSLTGRLLRFAISDDRESAADRFGAGLTGDPETLAVALNRMDGYAQVVPMEMTLAQSSAWTVNPLGGRLTSAWIFSSHSPPTDRLHPPLTSNRKRAAT